MKNAGSMNYSKLKKGLCGSLRHKVRKHPVKLFKQAVANFVGMGSVGTGRNNAKKGCAAFCLGLGRPRDPQSPAASRPRFLKADEMLYFVHERMRKHEWRLFRGGVGQ